MKFLAYIVLAYVLTQTAAVGADLATPTANATASTEDTGLRAEVLLQRAVGHYQDIKDSALADFTGKGEFVDGEFADEQGGDDGVFGGRFYFLLFAGAAWRVFQE